MVLSANGRPSDSQSENKGSIPFRTGNPFYTNYSMERIRYIYEIKNLINGKTYIGQHTLREERTIKTDFYYGSGILIKAAQKKYGLENFEKRIIIQGNFSKEEINRFEKCAIRIQRFLGKAEYNISDGGEGWNEGMREAHKKSITLEHNQKVSKAVKERWANMSPEERLKKAFGGVHKKNKGTTGFKFSIEQRQKMSESHKGEKNSSFGKHWFTNGIINIKCEICPEGFRPGRILVKKLEK